MLPKFIKPTKTKLILFVVLALIVIGGGIQGWVFSDSEGPKPFLYDSLESIPVLWPASVVILMPYTLIWTPFTAWEIDTSALPFPVEIALIGSYLYILSCALIGLFNLIPRQRLEKN
jgi:hypothetical protein